ncbi:MAG: ISL3 family transposase [Gemmatimonadaceae bacterium]
MDLLGLLNRVGGWAGFEIDAVEEDATLQPDVLGLPAPRLVITLRPEPGAERRCSRCGAVVAEVHDTTERLVRDVPVMAHDTWLRVPRARLRCPTCGPTVEAVPWLDKHQRMTTRLAEKIARLAMVLPIQHVAHWFGVHWSTVKQLHQRALEAALEAALGPITAETLADVRMLAIDEFAIQKGHRYATVIVDPSCKRVLWVARGRDRAAVAPFFDLLGPAGCARIEAVAMDMSGAFALEVRARCPQAAIVYDLFHVVAKYGREVIDRVRVDETNRIAKAAGPNRRGVRAARRVIKGMRWLLLRNRTTITRTADQVRLRELLAANRALFIVYVLKDDLKQLWRFRYPAAARRFWRHWYRRAMASRLAPLQAFARRLMPYVAGIIDHCRYPLNTAIVEGINNKIKVLKRMGYGYRDDAYFFLKIRAAFPGIP